MLEISNLKSYTLLIYDIAHYPMTSEKHAFITYPFPRQLLVDIKPGFYKVIGDGGKEEVIEADNAKDALGKTSIKEIVKIEYLGFSSKFILKADELIEDENYMQHKSGNNTIPDTRNPSIKKPDTEVPPPAKPATEIPPTEKPDNSEPPMEQPATEPPVEMPDIGNPPDEMPSTEEPPVTP